MKGQLVKGSLVKDENGYESQLNVREGLVKGQRIVSQVKGGLVKCQKMFSQVKGQTRVKGELIKDQRMVIQVKGRLVR